VTQAIYFKSNLSLVSRSRSVTIERNASQGVTKYFGLAAELLTFPKAINESICHL